MRVRRLDKDGDWTFGNGQANYLRENDAILQSVTTRLKSFKNDWFLDSEANIDWFRLLGSKDTKDVILREVERVTLDTYGVVRIISIDISVPDNREATISISLDTIYKKDNELGVTL